MPESEREPEVRAAGGLILRTTKTGSEIAVVHRPHHDDWSFPKGKAERGEDDEACARREVREETGLLCSIDRFFADSTYLDNKARRKLVRYFVMAPLAGEFTPNREVDELRFVSLSTAIELLTYPRDRQIASALLESTNPVP